MSIGGLIITLALVLIATVVVARPLFRFAPGRLTADANLQLQRERVDSYYERVLTNIRDLDEDFKTGKIAEADYREEREVWVYRGVRLLRVADSLDSERSPAATGALDADEIDREIERAVRVIREGQQAALHDMSDGEASA